MKAKKFEGKVVWITGASGGIGEALAVKLSSLGATLILSARRMSELERVKLRCHAERTYLFPLDLGEENSILTTSQAVIAQFPSIDYLFNNGGISQRSEAISTPISVDRRIFEVNFFGNILLSKQVLPAMIRAGSGHIIVTSSLVGKWGFYLRSAYSASKHALHGYYESLRMEVEQQGISITLVLPGFTATEISKNALDHTGSSTGAMDANQAGGLTPEFVAEKIIEGVINKKFEISIGKKEALGLVVKRFFPSYFEKLLRKWSAR